MKFVSLFIKIVVNNTIIKANLKNRILFSKFPDGFLFQVKVILFKLKRSIIFILKPQVPFRRHIATRYPYSFLFCNLVSHIILIYTLLLFTKAHMDFFKKEHPCRRQRCSCGIYINMYGLTLSELGIDVEQSCISGLLQLVHDT